MNDKGTVAQVKWSRFVDPGLRQLIFLLVQRFRDVRAVQVENRFCLFCREFDAGQDVLKFTLVHMFLSRSSVFSRGAFPHELGSFSSFRTRLYNKSTARTVLVIP